MNTEAKNIQVTVENNLCVSCSICKSICPTKCITFEFTHGLYTPVIDSKKCTQCGLCLSVCPGITADYVGLYGECSYPDDIYFGNYILCANAFAENEELRNGGVSGGVVTAIIRYCLGSGLYQKIFAVIDNSYKGQVKSVEINIDELTQSQKSRYVPVSVEAVAEYIVHNRDEKIVIVGTSCCIQGLLKMINRFRLERDNYLFLGLFCDKNMNYNVIQYFKDNFARVGIKEFYFRYKRKSGWPGDVHIVKQDLKEIDIRKQERMRVKTVFCLERCLYCIDKLNQFADISLGDNYTNIHMRYNDSNSVIVRTSRGKAIWDKLLKNKIIEAVEIPTSEIRSSQLINTRVENMGFSIIKSNSIGRKINIVKDDSTQLTVDANKWHALIKQLRKGQNYRKYRFILKGKRILSYIKRSVFR